jgi:hypothetical protein
MGVRHRQTYAWERISDVLAGDGIGVAELTPRDYAEIDRAVTVVW